MEMQAVLCGKYGGPEVLQLTKLPRPIIDDNEILIKTRAASITAADTMLRKGTPKLGRLFLGFRKPKHAIPGTGFAGVVEAVGKDVKEYVPGDKVFGETIFGFGTYAEFIRVQEDALISKIPDQLSFEEASTVCDGGLTSMNFLTEQIQIKKGDHILINGASGSLGTAAIQIAKHYGATVTAVCSSKNLKFVATLGADFTIDYQSVDFTNQIAKYDYVYDTIGKSSFGKSKSCLKEDGIYLTPVLSISVLLQSIFTSVRGSKKAKFSATGILPKLKLQALFNDTLKLVQQGKLKFIIDKNFDLNQASIAHRHIDSGRKRGNIVFSLPK